MSESRSSPSEALPLGTVSDPGSRSSRTVRPVTAGVYCTRIEQLGELGSEYHPFPTDMQLAAETVPIQPLDLRYHRIEGEIGHQSAVARIIHRGDQNALLFEILNC